MFGAEMGTNEYGVVIGNEAIFTREKPAKIGLTGMDLVRLGLERSRSAREALEIIIKLLEEYGQGGNGGYRYKLNYMNSFIIADGKEAYVLETVKRWWIWKKIKEVWSISNLISLEEDYDECAEGLIRNAIEKGYVKKGKDFNFKQCYSDRFMTRAAKGIEREKRSRELLQARNRKFRVKDFMGILRDHRNHYQNKQWTPEQAKATLYLHARDPLINRTQTVCSLVARVGKGGNFYYTTGASNPCLSPYFPIFLADTEVPEGYQEGKEDYSEKSYWWECEKYHRHALKNFSQAFLQIQPSLKAFEEKMIVDLEDKKINIDQVLINEYFGIARGMVRQWGKQLEKLKSEKSNWFYRYYWRRYNKINNLTIEK